MRGASDSVRNSVAKLKNVNTIIYRTLLTNLYYTFKSYMLFYLLIKE